MNNFKKIVPILIFLFLPVFKTWGADIVVECDDNADGNQCDIKSGTKLFSEDYLMPGQTVARSIQITNYDHNDDCHLKMSTKNESTDVVDMPQRLFTFIKKNGVVFYGVNDGNGNATSSKNLQNIFDASYIDFGKITNSGGSATYDWVVTLDTGMNNSYQGTSTSFDFSINFVCDHDESSNSETSSGGNTLGAITASVTQFLGFNPLPVTEQNAGEEQPSEESVAGVSTQEVAGATACKNPWWIWILFIVQFLIHLVLNKKSKKDRKVFSQGLLGILSAIVVYLTFCQKWLALVSVVISLFWIFIGKREE